MQEEKKIEESKEEIKIKVPKFTRPDVIEELTIENVKDTIEGQKMSIADLEREISIKKECIAHYQAILEANE